MNRIKPVFKCSDAYKKMFKDSQCALTISVGQKAHEGETFAATVELVNNSFQSCVILLDDSLQRHTMALNTQENADFFYETSLKEGDLWLKRNEEHYRKLTILKNIIRWDTWLKHPQYLKEKNKITLLIENNFFYKKIFDETIKEFLKRYMSRSNQNKLFNLEKARIHCLDYLTEECAILCLRSKLKFNSHFEIYPSRRNQAMNEIHKNFILPKYSNLLLPVAIKFKNRNTLQPQYFELLRNIKKENINEQTIIG